MDNFFYQTFRNNFFLPFSHCFCKVAARVKEEKEKNVFSLRENTQPRVILIKFIKLHPSVPFKL